MIVSTIVSMVDRSAADFEETLAAFPIFAAQPVKPTKLDSVSRCRASRPVVVTREKLEKGVASKTLIASFQIYLTPTTINKDLLRLSFLSSASPFLSVDAQPYSDPFDTALLIHLVSRDAQDLVGQVRLPAAQSWRLWENTQYEMQKLLGFYIFKC